MSSSNNPFNSSTNDKLNFTKRARHSDNKNSKIGGQEGSKKGKEVKHQGFTNDGKRRTKPTSEKYKAASRGPMRATKSLKPKGKFKGS